MNKTRFIRIFLLFWLSLISACQSVLSPAPVGTTTFTATAQPIVVTAPATQALPTAMTVKKSEILATTQSSILSKGIVPKRGNAKVSLPKLSGEYLVYQSKLGLIQYVSLDGTVSGNLIDGYLTSELDPILKTEGFDPVAMLPGQGTPRFLFMKLQEAQNQAPIFESALLWVTDVFGNLLETWRVLPNSDFACIDPTFSTHPYLPVYYPVHTPFYNWIGIDCFLWHGEGRNINLINLETGQTKSFTIQCEPGPSLTFVAETPSFFWSRAETDFSYRCPIAEYYFVSISGDHVIAKQLGDSFGSLTIQAVSPDWKHAVLDAGYMPKNADGTIPGVRILIENLDCVLNKPICDQGTMYDLPFSKPYDSAEINTQPSGLNLEWGHSGHSLIWASDTMGQIDLSTHTNHIFASHAPGLLLGISPDDKWMVFLGMDPNSNEYGLFDMSVDDNNITHFLAKPENMAGLVKFYGWMTIP